MSRILHLVNMGLRYGRSKGVRVSRQEEPPLDNLTAHCHLEESASHHFTCFLREAQARRVIVHPWEYLVEQATVWCVQRGIPTHDNRPRAQAHTNVE